MRLVNRGWLVLVSWIAMGGVARADYGDPGPESVTVAPNQPTAGGATSVQLAVPAGNGPYPLVVLSHGFSASGDNQIGWGKHFASYGFVAVVPSFPNTFSPNHTTNAAIIQQLVKLYTNPSTASAAKGKIDATRIGLEGHSAGGLATALAATSTIGAIVLLDPVDANDLGKNASPKICSPTLGLFAGPSACNNQAGWRPFVTTQQGPVTAANVVAGNHCDGENAPRALCGPFCGGAGADVGRQKVLARWATTFFLARLKNDAAAQTALGTIASDVGLTNVSSQAGTPCSLPPVGDAGVDASSPVDASAPVDAAPPVPKDASAPKDAAPTPIDPGPTDSSSGCSCRVSTSSNGGPATVVAALAVLAMIARRRQSQA